MKTLRPARGLKLYTFEHQHVTNNQKQQNLNFRHDRPPSVVSEENSLYFHLGKVTQ